MHTSGWKAGGAAGNTQSGESKLSWMSFLAFDFARATNESLYFAAHVFLYLRLGFGIITNLITPFFLRWGLNSEQRIKIGHWLNRPFPCAAARAPLPLFFALDGSQHTLAIFFVCVRVAFCSIIRFFPFCLCALAGSGSKCGAAPQFSPLVLFFLLTFLYNAGQVGWMPEKFAPAHTHTHVHAPVPFGANLAGIIIASQKGC